MEVYYLVAFLILILLGIKYRKNLLEIYLQLLLGVLILMFIYAPPFLAIFLLSKIIDINNYWILLVPMFVHTFWTIQWFDHMLDNFTNEQLLRFY